MSKEEIAKKESRNKTVLGVILALLMVMSTAGYALLNQSASGSDTNTQGPTGGNPSGQVVEYNKVKFVGQESGLWAFTIEGNTFYSTYTPQEVKHINVPFLNIQTLSGQTVYYPGNDLAISEIIGNINPFITRAQRACLKVEGNQTCEDNLPIKDCNSTFIIIKEADETETSRVITDNKCVIIRSKDTELLKTADALLFRILGIQ